MFTSAEIAVITSGTLFGSGDALVTGISTDSRGIRAGELFVPLRGPRFDGHTYIPDVITKGVSVVLSGPEWAAAHDKVPGAATVVVRDTLKALGDIAAAWRARFTLPVTGVTGSNGKTTTKEILASIMTLTGPGLKTAGNLNNLIGLPQMLFQLKSCHSWAVLEMGMSEPGEIDRLAEIARPEVGIITNAFPAHLESMGSVENVARAKGELFHRLLPGGAAVYNADDPLIAALPTEPGVIRRSFGLAAGEVTATAVTPCGLEGQQFTLHLMAGRLPVRFAGCGRHFLANALAAAAAAEVLGIEPEIIRAGLEQFRPGDRRFAAEKLGPLTVVNDSYNANPASMAAALETLTEVGTGRIIAALGDMLELGQDAEELHRMLGRQAGKVASRLYLIGDMAPIVAESALREGLAPSAISIGMTHDEIAADVMQNVQSGDLLLVKGSRGMAMDRIVHAIKELKS